ncbi:MAG: hypothetical protein JKY94_10390 [Rhodobacteraceae bacterium]|nr:hypothetical protein [Paracoccaceae bacterium]
MHDIIDERLRQENKEGWTPEHDDGHTDGSLAMAAALYATPVQLYEFGLSEFDVPQFTDPWPWKDMLHGQTFGNAWDNREKFDLRRSLVVAGALIAAEIERLDRATEKEAKELANGQNDT